MVSTLRVKNFGPIKDVDLTLKNVNVFIGEQSTGKSVLAKLFTIFKAPRKFFFKPNNVILKSLEKISSDNDFEEVKSVFEQYNIDIFLDETTEIEFRSALHHLTYKEKKLKYTANFEDKINSIEMLADDFANNKDIIISELKSLGGVFIYSVFEVQNLLEPNSTEIDIDTAFDKVNNGNILGVLKVLRSVEDKLSTSTALYIPSERNFINIIKGNSLGLQANKVPIPSHILSFGAELEKKKIKSLDLSFIQPGLKYTDIDGEERIFITDEKSILLKESSSGIQSVIPILSLLSEKNIFHRSFVIEEPELNLFPTTQYKLIQLLESKRQNFDLWEDVGTIHTYTTHSPYILSSLNNLLYAAKVKERLVKKDRASNISVLENRNINAKITKVVQGVINPQSFTAYQIKDGLAQSIFNEEAGLIDENFIDEATDKISDDFDDLMTLYNE